MSHCYQIFNVSDAIRAYEAYQKAFGAQKKNEEIREDGWVGIGMNVFGFHIFVQSFPHWAETPPENHGSCCISFSSEEELRKAYNILEEDAQKHSLHTDWGWTPLVALITDKFGVDWLFALE